MKRALLVILLIVLGVACTQQSSNVKSVSKTPASPTPPPPLSAARLAGKWEVVSVVKSPGRAGISPGEPARPFIITFRPSCSSGPCGGTWIYRYASAINKPFQRVNHGTFSSRGNGYVAVLSRASLSWCVASSNKGPKKRLSYHDTAVFVIHVTAAGMDKARHWMATRISGAATEHFAPRGCPATTATYSVQATKLCWLDPSCH